MGLAQHQLGERRHVGIGPVEPKRVGQQLAHVGQAERRQLHLVHGDARLGELGESEHQRVNRVDLVLPVSADHQQVTAAGAGEQEVDEPQRRGIGPLQVVEEERQRMLGRGEHLQEALERLLETALGLARSQRLNLRLRPDHELQLGDEIDEHLGVRPHRVQDLLAPARERFGRIAEDRAQQLPARA